MVKKLEWITFVIPLQNTSKVLNIILQKLSYKAYRLKYQYGINTEFVFIDNGSNDQTTELLQQNFKNQQVVVHREESPVTYNEAVKIGMEKASGEFIVCLDTNIQVPITFIDQLLKNIHDTKTVFIMNGIYMFHHAIAQKFLIKSGFLKSGFENEIRYVSQKYELVVEDISAVSAQNLRTFRNAWENFKTFMNGSTDFVKIRVNNVLGYY